MTKEKFYEITNYIAEIIKGSVFEGHIFAVGGSVRDLCMGNDIKDIDLVIDLPHGGVDFANFCEQHELTGKVVIYETYGTAMFHFKKFHDEEIECVYTRGEKYLDKDSRNPVTEFASIEEDAIRRDLTINALYYNVSTGKILDLVGGLKDIEDHIVRTTNTNPDIVFEDDPLRILRVIRFATRYGWEIEKKTFSSMKQNRRRLQIITKERIRDEFCKILMSKNAKYGVEMMHELGVMEYVVPELEDTVGLEQNAYHFGDVWVHSLAVLDNDCKNFEPDIICRLAALLHDIGKIKTRTVKDGKVHFYDHEYVGVDIVKDILIRLKFDNNTIDEVCFIVKNHMRTKGFGDDCKKMKDKSFYKFTYISGDMERFERVCRVIDDDNLAHEKSHCIKGQYTAFINKAKDTNMFGYKLPVDGNDVMSVLEIKPGPDIKEVLKCLTNLAFVNPSITRESCIKQMKHIYKQVKNK